MTGEDALRAALHRMLGDTPDGTDPRLRVGVDLVHVPRAAAVARRHGERWLADQFTPREREQLAAADGTPDATLAGRLAAKEAFLKLLAPDGELIRWRDIEVLRGPGGAPAVHPHGTALRRLRAERLAQWTLSITHEGEWAIAVAAALTDTPLPSPTTSLSSPTTSRPSDTPRPFPTTPPRSHPVQQIADWIQGKNPKLGREVEPAEDLIEGRLIDSLDFLEFIYLLESVSGRPIDLAEVTVDDFRTLERIEERFLAPAEGAA